MSKNTGKTNATPAGAEGSEELNPTLQLGMRIERECRARMQAGTPEGQPSATASALALASEKPKQDTLSPKQVTAVFEEIASTAQVVEQLTSMLMVDCFDNQDDADAVLDAANKLTQRIGLMADLYGSRCGAPHAPVIGGVDDWLMRGVFSADSGDGQVQGDSIR